MKNLLFLAAFLSLAVLNSCKTEDKTTAKNVIYEAAFDAFDGNSDLILKGEYIDKTGAAITINSKLPFKVTLENVPLSVKTGFKGYIFSTKAVKVVGKITMTVNNLPSNETSIQHKKDLDLSSGSALGFDAQELKDKTTFDFQE